MKLLEEAEWIGLDLPALFDIDKASRSPITAHIDKSLIQHFDVIIVDKLYPDPKPESLLRPVSRIKTSAVRSKREAEGKSISKRATKLTSDAYSMHSLIQEHQFQRTVRPTVVLYVHNDSAGRACHQILALFLNKNVEGVDLKGLVKDHNGLYSTVKACSRPCPDRPGIYMVGLRYNENAFMNPVMSNPRPAGYYSGKSPNRNEDMSDPGSYVYQTIQKAAALQSKVERQISPRLSLLRSLARHPHPGLLPGIPRDEVPASSMGVSKGFSSPIHNDVGYGGLTETISWNTSSVPSDSGLGFAVWPAKVVFDLCASPYNFVMVPSTLFHGTCPTAYPHEAIGFATITNGKLKRHFDAFDALAARIRDPLMAGYLKEGFLFTSRSPFYCCYCSPGSGGSANPCSEACASKIEEERERNRIRTPTFPQAPGGSTDSSSLPASKRRKIKGPDKGQSLITNHFPPRRLLTEFDDVEKSDPNQVEEEEGEEEKEEDESEEINGVGLS